MEQLQIYTLVDKSTAEHYFTEHWTKHIKSLPKFGFDFKGVWIGKTPETENQVIASVSFPDNANINEMTERYMKSPDFIEEMNGFDRRQIWLQKPEGGVQKKCSIHFESTFSSALIGEL